MYILVKFINTNHWRYHSVAPGDVEPEFLFINRLPKVYWYDWSELPLFNELPLRGVITGNMFDKHTIRQRLAYSEMIPFPLSKTIMRIYKSRAYGMRKPNDIYTEDVFIMSFDNFLSYAQKRLKEKRGERK